MEYSLNLGVDFKESINVDTLIDSGKYEALETRLKSYQSEEKQT